MLKSRYSDYELEAGLDEAGRGALAGPVVAAAVILPPDYQNAAIQDSKLLSLAQREKLRTEIMAEAVGWGVGMMDVTTIDKVNILQASLLAMQEAADGLPVKPDFLIVDGNRFLKNSPIPYACLIKGDRHYLSIAAASILAKTFRDDLMNALSSQYPAYGWDGNKGYPTKAHRAAILSEGLSPWHRSSFDCAGDRKAAKNQLSLTELWNQ